MRNIRLKEDVEWIRDRGTCRKIRGVLSFEEVEGKGELGESGLLPSHSGVI